MQHLSGRKTASVKSTFVLFLSTLLVATLTPIVANADEFVRVSGQVKPPSGYALLSGGVFTDTGITDSLSENGTYEIVAPKNRLLGLSFSIQLKKVTDQNSYGRTAWANFKTKVSLSESRTINLELPRPVQVKFSFYDASNNPFSGVRFGEVGFNNGVSPFVQSGLLWTGNQRIEYFGPQASATTVSTNVLEFFQFPTHFYPGIYFFDANRDKPSARTSGLFYSPDFSLVEDINLKLCFPVNFGNSLSLPADCSTQQRQEDQWQSRVPSETSAYQEFGSSVLAENGIEVWLDSINELQEGADLRVVIHAFQRSLREGVFNSGAFSLVLTNGTVLTSNGTSDPWFGHQKVSFKSFDFVLPAGTDPWFVKWHSPGQVGYVRSGVRWKVGDKEPPVSAPVNPPETESHVTSKPLTRFDVIQRTLAAFPVATTLLSATQRRQVERAVLDAPGAEKFICTGIRFESAPLSENIIVRKRAKAACGYAKLLNPNLSTWVQSKPTKARSYAGKVLLTIKSPTN